MPKFKTNDKVRIKKDYSPFWFPPLQNHYINRDVAIIIDGRDRKPLFKFKNDERVYELYEYYRYSPEAYMLRDTISKYDDYDYVGFYNFIEPDKLTKIRYDKFARLEKVCTMLEKSKKKVIEEEAQATNSDLIKAAKVADAVGITAEQALEAVKLFPKASNT